MSIIAYLNGEFLPLDQAKISVMDRGFLFGDGVYEVISVYDGHMFKLKEHLQRLQNSLDAIALKIDFDEQHWTKLLKNLCERNPAKNHYIYLQITRGAYPERLHGFPEETKPTVFAFAREVQDLDMKKLSAGLSAITLNDERGYQCHIKSTSLLANVLLKQQAIDNQATEAILIRDDQAIEGASSNFFIVKDNFLITPPKQSTILSGITRDVILELAPQCDLTIEQRPISKAELFTAEELWITSSIREIVPITQCDQKAIGTGRTGPYWHKIINLYQTYKMHS